VAVENITTVEADDHIIPVGSLDSIIAQSSQDGCLEAVADASPEAGLPAPIVIVDLLAPPVWVRRIPHGAPRLGCVAGISKEIALAVTNYPLLGAGGVGAARLVPPARNSMRYGGAVNVRRSPTSTSRV
jgi:hypothetical protein